MCINVFRDWNIYEKQNNLWSEKQIVTVYYMIIITSRWYVLLRREGMERSSEYPAVFFVTSLHK